MFITFQQIANRSKQTTVSIDVFKGHVGIQARHRDIPHFLRDTQVNLCRFRAVYRKTVEEIAAMLNNVNTSAAIIDRERLSSLDRRVTHLALVKQRYQNIRANILYARLNPKGRGRIQISAELPLIYTTGRRGQPSEVHFPTEAENEDKPQRIRKSKLELEPFLRSLPVYRYG